MAGASMKDIKLRIRSVESTMQITKAMQLVATSKLRRAKERMEHSKPYAAVSEQAMAAVIASCDDRKAPFLASAEGKTRCYVVIAGERGLAGGYNANIFKAMAAHSEGSDYVVLPIGRKCIEHFAHRGAKLISTDYPRVGSLSLRQCFALANRLTEGFLRNEYQEIWLVYTDFRSMMSQEVQVSQLLPVAKPKEMPKCGTVYDPDPETVLRSIMPDYLTGRVYAALCDSFASEVVSRRNAMDNATKNAGEMIDTLRLQYNRARQGSITQEITEIVAGAEH